MNWNHLEPNIIHMLYNVIYIIFIYITIYYNILQIYPVSPKDEFNAAVRVKDLNALKIIKKLMP